MNCTRNQPTCWDRQETEKRGESAAASGTTGARDQFLRSGVGITHNPDPQEILREVEDPLLSVVRMSSDFTPAYDPLLAIARALYEINRLQARTLLMDLMVNSNKGTECVIHSRDILLRALTNQIP